MLVTDMRPGDVIVVGAAAMMLTYRNGRAGLLIDAPEEVRVTFARNMREALEAAGWKRAEHDWLAPGSRVPDVKRLLEEARRLTCRAT